MHGIWLACEARPLVSWPMSSALTTSHIQCTGRRSTGLNMSAWCTSSWTRLWSAIGQYFVGDFDQRLMLSAVSRSRCTDKNQYPVAWGRALWYKLVQLLIFSVSGNGLGSGSFQSRYYFLFNSLHGCPVQNIRLAYCTCVCVRVCVWFFTTSEVRLRVDWTQNYRCVRTLHTLYVQPFTTECISKWSPSRNALVEFNFTACTCSFKLTRAVLGWLVQHASWSRLETEGPVAMNRVCSWVVHLTRSVITY